MGSEVDESYVEVNVPAIREALRCPCEGRLQPRSSLRWHADLGKKKIARATLDEESSRNAFV